MYKPLSYAGVQKIASAYFTERQSKTHPQEHPTIALVGGQPGAGKSAVSVVIRSEFHSKGGFIHVDADRMRERIRTGDRQLASEETQADAGRLVTELRRLAIQNRRNIIEEGTFRNAGSAVKFLRGLQEQGYNVEFFAVTTSREESLLGIFQRHELQHAAGAHNPRFVAESYHDNAMHGFDTTVATAATYVDRVRVINRAGEVLYDSNAQHNSQANALEALVAGRKVTDAQLIEIGKAWMAVEAAATERGAPSEYLDSIANHCERIDNIKKERIHEHAMRQLEANAAVLAQDLRYIEHSNSELTKASYFRGFHEKASEFKGISPDFATYDKTVAIRATLRQLPDVADIQDNSVQRSRVQDGHSL